MAVSTLRFRGEQRHSKYAHTTSIPIKSKMGFKGVSSGLLARWIDGRRGGMAVEGEFRQAAAVAVVTRDLPGHGTKRRAEQSKKPQHHEDETRSGGAFPKTTT